MFVNDVIDLIMLERQRSLQIHGHWHAYPVDRMLDVTLEELIEAGEAEIRGDMLGPHGVIAELIQTASCCIKAVEVLTARANMTLAESSQPTGLHIAGEGSAARPSLTHIVRIETCSNHPKGEPI